MKAKPDLTQEELRELFDYNDGMIWRNPPARSKRKPGDRAGYFHKSDGYRFLMVHKKHYAEHRCVWVWHNGAIPDGLVVDHMNKGRADNRIENLQLLTPRLNTWTRGRLRADTQHLPPCVYPTGDRFYVLITKNKKPHNLGTFNSVDEAVAAREAFIK